MTMQQDIENFALAQLRVERAFVAHQQPDPRDVATVQDGLSLARSVGPEIEARLGAAVAQARQGLLAQERVEIEHQQGMLGQLQDLHANAQLRYAQALRNAGANRVSQVAGLGRDGKELNEAQLAEAAAKGRYTVPGRVRGADAARMRMSQTMGREVSRAEYKRTLDHLGHLFDNPNAMSKYLDEQVGDDGVERAKLERSIRNTVIAAGLVERQDRNAKPDEFKPVRVEMTAEERRRLDVADRVMAESGPLAFMDEVRDKGAPGSIREALVDAVESSVRPDNEVVEAGREVREIEQVASEL